LLDAGGDLEVREVMTPGVVNIVEDASVLQARRALQSHRVHAVLVVGRASGRPLGWVTARGLLAWIDADEALGSAREAIREPAIPIEPSASVREAAQRMLGSSVSHLIVQRKGSLPEGTLAEIDVLALGRR
jgi:CBS domain-containing protein